MPPNRTQISAGKRKSTSQNGQQMKKSKKATVPALKKVVNECSDEEEPRVIKGFIGKQRNGGRASSNGNLRVKDAGPQRTPKTASQKKKLQMKKAAPDSDEAESDDHDDDEEMEPPVPRIQKSKPMNKKKPQAKASVESSEEEGDDDDDEGDVDDDDDDDDDNDEEEEEEDEDSELEVAQLEKSHPRNKNKLAKHSADGSDDEGDDIDDDDELDEDDGASSSVDDEEDDDDDDIEADEDADEETGEMESDPESGDEPMEVSSKKPSITAARKKKAQAESDDDDIPSTNSKSVKSKLKKLASDSDDDSENEQEKPPKKKAQTKVDGKQIDEKLEEIFDTYKTTEAEVEQFRKNYVTMVRSWLFIPRVAVGATVEEIQNLHPKITKVKLPTKTKEGKSFAFLNFASPRDAEEALKELSKQTCVVAEEPVKIQKAREFGMTPPAYINRKKLSIIACPKETTQEELCKLFPQATTVWLSKNARTDTVENYLSFPDEAIAKEALAENGTVSLHGKCCALFFDNYSYKKKTAGRKLKKKLGSGKTVDVEKITPDAPKRMKKIQKRDSEAEGKRGGFSSNMSKDRDDEEGDFRSNVRGGFRGGRGTFRGREQGGFQQRGRGSFGRGRGGSDRGGRGGSDRGGRGGFNRGRGRGSFDGGERGGFDRSGRGGFDRGGRGGRGGRGSFGRGGRGGFSRGRGGSDRRGRGGFGRGRGSGGFNRGNRTGTD